MPNSGDNWRLQSDLEKLRTERMKTEEFVPGHEEPTGYGLIFASIILVVASFACFYLGYLGIEAGLSLLVLLAATVRALRLRRARDKKRDDQVRKHRMISGNPEYWGRGKKS